MPPTQGFLARGRAAGKGAARRDLAAVPFDPAGPVPKGFRYGRVAGVSVGDVWNADLTALAAGLAPGARLGVPVASLYLNRLGTGQNQSAAMRSRYADTAYQAHGNYGVRYELAVELRNPDAASRSYDLALSHPARVVGDKPATAAVFMDPPGKPVMFRGPVQVRYHADDAAPVNRFVHLVVRHGEELPPFETVVVPPKGKRKVWVTLYYPADATPPQLLTIARK